MKDIEQMREQGMSWSQIGAALGTTKDGARNRWRRAKQKGWFMNQIPDNLYDYRVKSLDDLMTATDVDLTKYDVSSYKVNKWEMGAVIREEGEEPRIVTEPMWQVKATLVPKISPQVEFAQALMEEAMAHRPTRIERTLQSKTGKLLEISIADLHAGKYAWCDETGEDYDTDIALTRFENACKDLLSRATDVERILFVVGNDLMHVDSPRNETYAGTTMDVDTRFQRTYRMVLKALIRCINLCIGIAPTDVLIVPGNHDKTATWTLGEALSCWYKESDVKIINTSSPNKYYQWGKVMLGFHHGDIKAERLPLIMAQDQPQMWAETRYREIHLGHWHKNKATQWVGTDEHTGVIVRVLPSLSGTDAWHRQQGFVGNNKQAVAFLWDRDHGLQAQYVHCASRA